MFGWVKRLWAAATNKVEGLLDKIEDPKAVLDQCIRDMGTEIQEARTAFGLNQVQLKKSGNDLAKYKQQVIDFDNMATRYTLSRDDVRARKMLKRKREAEKMVEHHRVVTENLQSEVDRLRESILSMENKQQEAKDRKYTLLAQKQAVEALSKSNRTGVKYTGSGSAFQEYDRICEKITDSSAEQEALSYIPSDLGGSADLLLMEGSVDTELEELKKKLGVSVDEIAQIEHKKNEVDFNEVDFNEEAFDHELFNPGFNREEK